MKDNPHERYFPPVAAARGRTFMRARTRLAFVATLSGLFGAICFEVGERFNAWVPEAWAEFNAAREPTPVRRVSEPVFAIGSGAKELLRLSPATRSAAGVFSVGKDMPNAEALVTHGTILFCSPPDDGTSLDPIPPKSLAEKCRSSEKGLVRMREEGACRRLITCDGKAWLPL